MDPLPNTLMRATEEVPRIVLARDLRVLAEICERLPLGPDHPEVRSLLEAHRGLVDAWAAIDPEVRRSCVQLPDEKEPAGAAMLDGICPGLADFLRSAAHTA